LGTTIRPDLSILSFVPFLDAICHHDMASLASHAIDLAPTVTKPLPAAGILDAEYLARFPNG
jgi:hypothetical protein